VFVGTIQGNSRSIWQGEETQSSDSEVRGT
jgi:hypothetical protein